LVDVDVDRIACRTELEAQKRFARMTGGTAGGRAGRFWGTDTIGWNGGRIDVDKRGRISEKSKEHGRDRKQEKNFIKERREGGRGERSLGLEREDKKKRKRRKEPPACAPATLDSLRFVAEKDYQLQCLLDASLLLIRSPATSSLLPPEGPAGAVPRGHRFVHIAGKGKGFLFDGETGEFVLRYLFSF